MGYRLKRLDEPIFMAGPKPMRTDFGIHQRLESCDSIIDSEVRFSDIRGSGRIQDDSSEESKLVGTKYMSTVAKICFYTGF